MPSTATATATSPALLRPGAVLVRPVTLQRLEGAALAAVAIGLYAGTGPGWGLFAALLLLPDLGMLGYLAGPRVGAATYNLTHSLVVPLGLVAAGMWVASEPTVAVALVWIAHIGLDRMLGYGLKLPSAFRDTHLGRVGRG